VDILISGSVAYDYLMTFPGYFRDHILPEHLEKISLSFLVDSMVRQRGGIAPNIAYTLALLGGRPRLWAAVGEDFEEYRAWLESIGVDASGARVIPGVFTASFFVNTDRSNAQIASFYPGAMAFAAQLSLRELEENPPELVLISPNDPAAMNLYVRECQEMGVPYLYDPSQQIVRLSADDLRRGICGAMALFVNEYEAALIQNMTGWDPQAILRENPEILLVITCGAGGTSIYKGSEHYDIPVVPPKQILDPTGVGDAFRGGFLSGYGHGLDLETCGRMGALAATYCLEASGPQAHNYTLQEFVQRYRESFDDPAALAALLHN
jgi:adenosine kinase